MKKGAIIGIVVAVVVLVIGGAAAAAFYFEGDYIANRYKLITEDDRGYFEWLANRQFEKTMAASGDDEESEEPLDLDDGIKANLSMKLHVTDDFCDRFGLYSFKDDRLDIDLTLKDKEYSLGLTGFYDNKELIKILGLADLGRGLVYMQVPDYNSGVVDLSEVLESDIDGQTLKEFLNDTIENAGDEYKKAIEQVSGNEVPEDLRRELFDCVMGGDYEVELEKDKKDTFGDKEQKYTEITLNADSKALKSLLKDMYEVYDESGFMDSILDAFPENYPAEMGITNLEKSFDDAVDSLDKSLKAELVLYVGMRCELLGYKFTGSMGETKLSFKTVMYTDGDEDVRDISCTVNSVRALELNIRTSKTDNGTHTEIILTPGQLIDNFLGDYSGYGLKIGFDRETNGGALELGLLDTRKTTLLASVSVSVKGEKYTAPLIDYSGSRIYDLDTLDSSDYLDVEKAVKLGLDILDKVGEQFVEDFVNEKLQEYFGEYMTIDYIREMYENGMFNTSDANGDAAGAASSDNFGEEGGPDAEPSDNGGNGTEAGVGGPDAEPSDIGGNGTEAGVGSPDAEPSDNGGNGTEAGVGSPDGTGEGGEDGVPVNIHVPSPEEPEAEYPKYGVNYYYSRISRIDEDSIGQYRDLVIPSSGDIDEEALQAERDRFLAEYSGNLMADSSKISVDWNDGLIFDIVPLIGGFPVSTFAFSDCYALIGRYDYGEGIDDLVIGMKVGETKDIYVTLSSDMFGDYTGYSGNFRLTVRDIERTVQPAWTEEFICGVAGFESLEACDAVLAAGIEADADVNAQKAPEELLFDMALANFAEASGTPVNDREELENSFFAAVAEKEGIYVSGEELTDIVEAICDERLCTYEELIGMLPLEAIVDGEIERRIRVIVTRGE